MPARIPVGSSSGSRRLGKGSWMGTEPTNPTREGRERRAGALVFLDPWGTTRDAKSGNFSTDLLIQRFLVSPGFRV